MFIMKDRVNLSTSNLIENLAEFFLVLMMPGLKTSSTIYTSGRSH